jgi:membrane associated rhomboid family serine protease
MWPVGIALEGEWPRLLTSAFLHGSFLHIAFNMYVLFALGPTLERILGHGRFVVLYLVSALGGSVASYVFSDLRTVSVGASGAIFGLMGALVVAGKRLRYDVRQVLVLLAVNVVIGFIAPGVDWRAHLGGLVTGAAVAAVFVLAPRANRLLWQILGILGIVGVLVVLVMYRTLAIQELAAPLIGR